MPCRLRRFDNLANVVASNTKYKLIILVSGGSDFYKRFHTGKWPLKVIIGLDGVDLRNRLNTGQRRC